MANATGQKGQSDEPGKIPAVPKKSEFVIKRDDFILRKKAVLDQFSAIRDKNKRRVLAETDKLKAGYTGKTYNFRYSTMEDDVLKRLNLKTDEEQKRADILAQDDSEGTVERLSALKDEFEKELGLDTDNIIAMLNKMTGPEAVLTREGLAKMELYIGQLQYIMEVPEAKPLAKIFKELTLITSLNEDYQKVLEDGVLSSNRDVAVLTLTLLTLAKDSVKDEFTKGFINNHPENALKTVLFGNLYGCYSAFEVKKYYEYAISTYEANPNEKNKEPLVRFKERLGKFDNDEKEFQTAKLIQEKIQERAKGLDAKAYGEDAVSRLRPGAILRTVGKGVAYASLVGNGLANRPEMQRIYNEEGLLPALKFAASNPYVIGSGVTIFAINRYESEETMGQTFAPESERKAREYAKGLERFLDLVEMHSTWGMFLENDGAKELIAYQKFLEGKTGLEAEPTIKGFEEFITKMEKEEGITDKTGPSKYLGKKVFDGKFAKDETENLKTYLNLMKEQNIQDKKAFNKKLDEARQNI